MLTHTRQRERTTDRRKKVEGTIRMKHRRDGVYANKTVLLYKQNLIKLQQLIKKE